MVSRRLTIAFYDFYFFTGRKNVKCNKRRNTTDNGELIEIDDSRKIQFTLVDKVWLIMKSIFDERTFTFSENGLITEHKK